MKSPALLVGRSTAAPGDKLQAPSLKLQAASNKRQATSLTGPELWDNMGIMKTYKYKDKKVTKKFWLERLKKYPGWQRKLEIIKKTGKYRTWQIC